MAENDGNKLTLTSQSEFFEEEANTESKESQIKKMNLSADFGVMVDAIKHNGFGFGINWEYLFTRLFSVHSGFNHSIFLSESGNAVYTSETIGLNLYCYPFRLGLDKYFYLGGGNSVEFIQLSGDDFNEDNNRKTAMFFQARAGWRQPLNKYIGLEALAGYKKLFYSVDLPKDCEHLVDQGFFFGFDVNLNFGNIIRAIKKFFRD